MMCYFRRCWRFYAICWLCQELVAVEPVLNADAAMTIRAAAGASEIVITTTPRLAGAIHSLTWAGQEFIDSTDHGRQLQSASAFDLAQKFENSETYNPTEAGSVRDGAGPTSTSRLLHRVQGKSELQTTTQMAFWLPPDGKSAGLPAKNSTALSNHLLTKRVRIGYRHLPHVIQYDVTFHTPLGEQHYYAQYEALTAYMPSTLSKFWTFDAATGKLAELSAGPGEQPRPVIASTTSGEHALGIFSPVTQPPGMSRVSYGRFVFEREQVTKWNCVFRQRSPVVANRERDYLPAGDYQFALFVIVGELETVRQNMIELRKLFPEQ